MESAGFVFDDATVDKDSFMFSLQQKERRLQPK